MRVHRGGGASARPSQWVLVSLPPGGSLVAGPEAASELRAGVRGAIGITGAGGAVQTHLPAECLPQCPGAPAPLNRSGAFSSASALGGGLTTRNMSRQPAHSDRGQGASQSAADPSQAHLGSFWGSTLSGWEKSDVLMNPSVSLTWGIKYVPIAPVTMFNLESSSVLHSIPTAWGSGYTGPEGQPFDCLMSPMGCSASCSVEQERRALERKMSEMEEEMKVRTDVPVGSPGAREGHAVLVRGAWAWPLGTQGGVSLAGANLS